MTRTQQSGAGASLLSLFSSFEMESEDERVAPKRRRTKRYTLPETEEDDSPSEECEESEAAVETSVRGHDASVWQDGRAVLYLAELTARGLRPPAPTECPEGRAIAEAYRRLQNRLSVIREGARSFRWDPGFPIRRAHAIRVRPAADEVDKELVRRTGGACQLCGTRERGCRFLVDLCGLCEADGASSGYDATLWSGVEATDVCELYRAFDERYDRIFADEFVKGARETKTAPPEFLGTFSVGKTCLRQIVLGAQAGNCFLQLVQRAEAEIVCLGKDDPGWKAESTVTDDRVDALLNELRRLEAAAADARRRAPDPPLPSSALWSQVDCAIAECAAYDDEAGLELAGDRARSHLCRGASAEAVSDVSSDGPSDGPSDGRSDAEWAGSSDEEDEGECEGGASNEGRKRRHAVRGQDHRQAEERAGGGVGRQRLCRDKDGKWARLQEGEGARPRPPARAPASRAASSSAPSARRLERPRSSDAAPAGRYRAPFPSERTPVQRAADLRVPGNALASRRRIVTELLGLASKLNDERRDSDASLCTSAALVVQELVSALESARG